MQERVDAQARLNKLWGHSGMPPVMELPCGCIWEYECTRCRGCYVHQHVAIYNEQLERWQWKCHRDIRRIVLEKRPEDRGRRLHG